MKGNSLSKEPHIRSQIRFKTSKRQIIALMPQLELKKKILKFLLTRTNCLPREWSNRCAPGTWQIYSSRKTESLEIYKSIQAPHPPHHYRRKTRPKDNSLTPPHRTTHPLPGCNCTPFPTNKTGTHPFSVRTDRGIAPLLQRHCCSHSWAVLV